MKNTVWMLLISGSLALVGCGGAVESGPPRFRLSGKVTFDGKPVPAGTIYFEPATGPAGSAQIKDGQYDTANGMAGGADPVQPILDWPGRGITTHLKEWSGEHGAKVIGEGMVPWDKVFDACERVAGTQWYIVEHESYEGMSPMQVVEACLKNLRGMGK